MDQKFAYIKTYAAGTDDGYFGTHFSAIHDIEITQHHGVINAFNAWSSRDNTGS